MTAFEFTVDLIYHFSWCFEFIHIDVYIHTLIFTVLCKIDYLPLKDQFFFFLIIIIIIIIIILLLLLLLASFSHQCKLMVYHWSLSNSKLAPHSRTLQSILADFNKAVVWWSRVILPFPTLPELFFFSHWELFQVY